MILYETSTFHVYFIKRSTVLYTNLFIKYYYVLIIIFLLKWKLNKISYEYLKKCTYILVYLNVLLIILFIIELLSQQMVHMLLFNGNYTLINIFEYNFNITYNKKKMIKYKYYLKIAALGSAIRYV